MTLLKNTGPEARLVLRVGVATGVVGVQDNVEGDGHVQVLGSGPEGVVVFVAVADAVHGGGTDERALHAGPGSPFKFLDSLVDVPDGYVGYGEEAVGVGGAEVNEPAVVGRAIGGGEGGVFTLGFPAKTEGREEEGLVDAFLVQMLDPGVGVDGARCDVLDLVVGEGGMLHHPLPGLVYPGDPAQGAAVVADADFAIDIQVFQVELIDVDAQGAVSEPGIHVLLPEVGGFHDVAVCIYDDGTGHDIPPEKSGASGEFRVYISGKCRVNELHQRRRGGADGDWT